MGREETPGPLYNGSRQAVDNEAASSGASPAPIAGVVSGAAPAADILVCSIEEHRDAIEHYQEPNHRPGIMSFAELVDMTLNALAANLCP